MGRTVRADQAGPVEREALLARHPPRYARAVADHVTFGPAGEGEDMPRASSARLVGRADDGEGVEAMVVAIDGSTARPTGGRGRTGGGRLHHAEAYDP